jgi:hypothetical protein
VRYDHFSGRSALKGYCNIREISQTKTLSLFLRLCKRTPDDDHFR